MTDHLLILRPGAIGDTLVTLPALLALRQRFPVAAIQFVGNPAAAPLVQVAGVIDSWISFDDRQVLHLFGEVGSPCREHLPCDAGAVAWCADPNGVLLRSLGACGAKQPIIASSRPAPGVRVHVARQLMCTLVPLGISADTPLDLPPITVPANAVAEAERELAALGLAGRPFVAIHPGSGSKGKNWPAERYAAVIDALAAQDDLPSLILAGEADDDTVARLKEHTHQRLRLLVGQPLTVVAAALQQARAFLGNDSGLAHLAGQLGVPTLALFGPTDPTVWSPLGPRVQALHADPLASLTVETVLAALLLA